MMKLVKFQVTNFRSVDDSGWIHADAVTALIGTNESGKTNVLLPLWKLSPAKDGDIVPTSDYPRKHYNEFRSMKSKPVFIRAVFDVGTELASELVAATGLQLDDVRKVEVARDLDGKYFVEFPDGSPARSVPRSEFEAVLSRAAEEIERLDPLKTEVGLKDQLVTSLKKAREAIGGGEDVVESQLRTAVETLESVKVASAPKTSTIVPRHRRALEEIRALRKNISRPAPGEVEETVKLVVSNLPKFVYYSTYGNLDSEIYLPHVIANLSRKDLGLKEAAKARTLKVLFEFVKLKPQEILELGRDFKDPNDPNRQPTEEEIASITEKKKERSILLQSASTLLTKKFRDWWKQGEYRFRFEADGNHFRIWVSDDQRPEEIELEGRSTGLQWFLSFYLVFLVERADEHEASILLLDEPGLSLHPLAQRDLSAFFDGLAEHNQLLYTCHSPFLVDADRLDRVRKVYVGSDGTSKVTPDLRAAEGDVGQRGAAYAVHAALGLSVAESLLLGCEPVVVEGTSDQHYLTAVKNLLIASGRLKPGRELVFPPAGGARGVKAVASILGGRDEALPVALFDSDEEGRATTKALREGLYAGDTSLLLDMDSFAPMQNSEVEDLFPPDRLVRQLDRWQRAADVPFADEFATGEPIVPQIKAWARRHGVVLETPGWKVELAKRVKQELLKDGVAAIATDDLDRWTALFDAFATARKN